MEPDLSGSMVSCPACIRDGCGAVGAAIGEQVVVNRHVTAPMTQMENGYRHNSQTVIHNGETVFLCFDSVFAAYSVFAANATLIPLPIVFFS